MFNATQFPSKYCRKMARSFLDIAPSGFGTPLYAISQGILMAYHHAFRNERFHVTIEGHRSFGGFGIDRFTGLSCNRSPGYCRYN